jgi:PAS domain S-box-containing protein
MVRWESGAEFMGNDQEKSLSETAELRRRAEELQSKKTTRLSLPRTEEETQRLVHELEVHQIELEMQNAELSLARNQLEMALQRYTNLYDFAPVAYFALDRNEIIRAVNLTGTKLLGIERSQLLGWRFGLFIAPEARSLFATFLAKVFASRGKETLGVTLAGEASHLNYVLIEAVADASGKECRMAVIDVTERRHAADALTEKRRELEVLNKTLETRIAEAVNELRQRDQILILHDRLALMGEMINNIAHQWRQPLNTLGLVVQQVQLYFNAGEFSKEFLDENTATAMGLIKFMSQTIDDFRNFFRSDKEAVPFSAQRVISRTLSLIQKSFEDQKISIDFNPDGDPIVTGYPNEYAQVLLNILMNARDALIDRNADDARISLHLFAEGDRTVVTVTDNGGGIADEIMDKIFDPYFTTKGPDKGTGIGLFMSKTIIEKNMGGKLTVSNSGGGAQFRIEV